MNDIRIVAAIMGDAQTAYRVGEPLIGNPDSVVENIIQMGTNIEVFARSKDQSKGFHESLLSPSVSTLVSLASKSDLGAVLKMMEVGEKQTAVYATDGKVWKLDSTVPGDDSTRIVRIAQDEDMVQIVAIPNTGHPLDVGGFFVIFTLMPLSFLRVSAEASLSEWLAMQAEMQSDEGDEEDEDEEDEEEEEQPVAAKPLPAALVPPPPPPPLNGAVQTQTQEATEASTTQTE